MKDVMMTAYLLTVCLTPFSRYKIKEMEARAFENFMMKMLTSLPEKRATAQEMLRHPWLKGSMSEYEYKMSEAEIADF